MCHRIKPHTSISGEVESGLCKIMTVGLGNHKGACAFHHNGFSYLSEALLETARVFLRSQKILFGIGIVENAYERTMKIEAILPDNLVSKEKELLKLAKENMPRLLMDEVDVLIVERMGKDISGAGMDPNITGRPVTPMPRKTNLHVQTLVVLDLTPASHGNATGIGAADITTRRMLNKINFTDLYTNVLTSGATMAARLPVIVNDDEEAVRVAIRVAHRQHLEDVKVVRIENTLNLSEIMVSENFLPLLEGDKRFKILETGLGWKFDKSGTLEK